MQALSSILHMGWSWPIEPNEIVKSQAFLVRVEHYWILHSAVYFVRVYYRINHTLCCIFWSMQWSIAEAAEVQNGLILMHVA